MILVMAVGMGMHVRDDKVISRDDSFSTCLYSNHCRLKGSKAKAYVDEYAEYRDFELGY